MEFAFTDVAGEHYLVWGPAGISFAPEWNPAVCFVVKHYHNAASLAAWLANEQECYVCPVWAPGQTPSG